MDIKKLKTKLVSILVITVIFTLILALYFLFESDFGNPHQKTIINLSTAFGLPASILAIITPIYLLLFRDDFKSKKETVFVQGHSKNINNNGSNELLNEDLYKLVESLTLGAIYIQSVQRLSKETERLKNTSNKNLFIGISFVIISLLLIYQFYIISPNSSDDSLKILQFWLPRFFSILLVQLSGFFFLRNYVANELDIKHNKNEMTNIESKMLAALLAKESDDPKNLKLVIQELAKTERNFILKKDEKTTSIEGKEHYNDMKDIFNKFIDKIPSVKNNNPNP